MVKNIWRVRVPMKTSMKVRNYLILSATTTTNHNAPYLNLQFRKRKMRVKVSCFLLHVVQENRVRTHARTHTHTHIPISNTSCLSVCVCAQVSLQNRCVRRAHGMLFTPRANKFSAPRRHATMTTGGKQWRRRKFQPTAG